LGLVLLLVFQLATDYSLQFLLAGAREAERRSASAHKIIAVEELALIALGPKGVALISVSGVMLMAAACVICIILISQFSEKLSFLKKTSSLTLVALGVSTLVVIHHYCFATETAAHIKMAVPSLAYKAASIQCFAFICHFNLLPIMAEMDPAQQHKAPMIIRGSMFAVGLIYGLFGALGYLLLGDEVDDNILLSEEFSDTLGVLACVLLLLGNLFKYPLMCLPLLDSALKLVNVEPANGRRGRRFVQMACLNGTLWVLVVLLKNLTAAFSILGATCGPSIAFIFPGLVYAKLVDPLPGYAMVVFGIGVCIICFAAFFE